jgi:hypothetical protein
VLCMPSAIATGQTHHLVANAWLTTIHLLPGHQLTPFLTSQPQPSLFTGETLHNPLTSRIHSPIPSPEGDQLCAGSPHQPTTTAWRSTTPNNPLAQNPTWLSPPFAPVHIQSTSHPQPNLYPLLLPPTLHTLPYPRATSCA